MKKVAELKNEAGHVTSVSISEWLYEGLERLLTPDPPPPPPPPPDEGEKALKTAVIPSNSNNQIAKWDVTATLVEVEVTPGRIGFPFYQDPSWPEYQTRKPGTNGPNDPGSIPIVGNIWFGAKIDGQWHFGTVDWLKPGQQDKSLDVPKEHVDTAHALHTFIKRGVLGNYIPKKGDECGWLVSSVARNGHTTTRERSNVILVEWPY